MFTQASSIFDQPLGKTLIREKLLVSKLSNSFNMFVAARLRSQRYVIIQSGHFYHKQATWGSL